MSAKKSTKKPAATKPKPKEKPTLAWQTGEYERIAEFRLCLPYQFLLLCRLMDVTPKRVVTEFMENMDCGSWERKGRDKAKEHLVAYFLEMGYGKELYSTEDIRTMFREMDAIGLLWPGSGGPELIEVHSRWRDIYQVHWFERWWGRVRRF